MHRPMTAALLALGVVFAATPGAGAADLAARTVPAKVSGVVVGTNLSDPATATYDAPPPPGQSKIAGNFAKYTKGKYICCFGFGVSGPSSGVGQQWLAIPFTPASNTTVKTISVALSHTTGTNAAVITLNADSGGVPGATALATFPVSGLPSFGTTGTCCTVTTVTSAGGVAVTGGHTYWVVIKTDAGSATFRGVWHANEINQISSQSGAVNQGSWATTSFKPGLAFKVSAP